MSDIDDDEISIFEDDPEEDERETSVIACAQDADAYDSPIYRLRLSYSEETFLAIYGGGSLAPGTMVVVPTRYGRDLAKVLGPLCCRRGSAIVQIERPAEQADLDRAETNRSLEDEAFQVFKEKAKAHRLDMKLVHVHYLLDEPKILFFFTAESRVDFRELVKDLVGIFKTRIELRQIGVRDEARIVSGLGICGRGCCCNAVSDKLKPVSIKMAKDQNLSFNSMKISGPCGRLLCCLSFEHGFYSEQVRLVPKVGSRIAYDNATWTVAEVNLLSGKVKLSDPGGRSITLDTGRFERVDNRWQIKG
ncbi:MAG: hypothetical protein FWE09_03620 [Treponema sp.]|nr:hypothetical protein [Treponema sp.]